MASSLRIAALLAALSVAPVARAQTASDRETARGLMDEGFARREKNDHKGALERFEAADALMHVPTTGIEAARERVALGQLIEAREALGAVIRYPTKSGEPPPFGEARMHAQRLDDELGARIPSLRIVLRGADGNAGASVSVDGADVPVATLIAPRRLNPGAHTVVARAGRLERRETVSLRERESKELIVDLSFGTAVAPAPAPPAPSPSPSTPSEGGDPTPAEANASPSAAPKIMLWGGVTLALAGTAVGTVTGLVSLSAVSSAKSGCLPNNRCPPVTHDDIDKARSLGNVSTVAFILGGVGAVLAVAGYFVGKSEPKPEGAFVPWIGPGSAGLRARF